MSKVDIKKLDSVTANDTTATALINENFAKLQAGVEDALSRTGKTPNFMDTELDMNSRRIINCGEAVGDNDVVTYKVVKDSITTATGSAEAAANSAIQAATSAQSALVSATNAINSLRNAEDTLNLASGLLTETQQYVEAAKADIDVVVQDAKDAVDDTIAGAVEDVKQEAMNAANSVIDQAAELAATSAKATVDTYVMEVVVPQADVFINRAEQAAINADADAENCAESAGIAAEEADEAKQWADHAKIWATGEDAEVETIAPGEGKHSSREYASRAEESAIAAAEAADRAQSASGTTSGKVIQLGFDGATVRTGLEFKHAPSGVEIPYTLEDNQEYEIDLLFNGTLPTGSMYIKNGNDTINFVSTLHRTSTDSVDIDDMKQVMRYNADTGYRWLFKAVYKVTPAGNKVFLLYPVVAKEDIDIIDLGTVRNPTFKPNKVYKATINSSSIFYMATVTDTSVVNQTKIYLTVAGDVAINWGSSTKFYNGVIPTIENGGVYEVFYEYNPNDNTWVVGVLSAKAV